MFRVVSRKNSLSSCAPDELLVAYTKFPMFDIQLDSDIFVGIDIGHHSNTVIHCYCHQKWCFWQMCSAPDPRSNAWSCIGELFFVMLCSQCVVVIPNFPCLPYHQTMISLLKSIPITPQTLASIATARTIASFVKHINPQTHMTIVAVAAKHNSLSCCAANELWSYQIPPVQHTTRQWYLYWEQIRSPSRHWYPLLLSTNAIPFQNEIWPRSMQQWSELHRIISPCHVVLQTNQDHTKFPILDIQPDNDIFVKNNIGHHPDTGNHCYCHQQWILYKTC